MATIYEKEAVFDKLNKTFECLKGYIYDAVDHEELHEVEQQIFRKVQEIGRQSLECFVFLSGSGYEEGNPPLSDEGIEMRYKGTVDSPYMSIFGEVKIARAAYQHPMGGYFYPIDATLNLPAHKYSYLLEKWLQASACESDFIDLRAVIGATFNRLQTGGCRSKFGMTESPLKLRLLLLLGEAQ